MTGGGRRRHHAAMPRLPPAPPDPHDASHRNAAALDARAALDGLWRRLAGSDPASLDGPSAAASGDAGGVSLPDPLAELRLRRLLRSFGLHAEHCVAALVADDRAALIRESADTLKRLMEIWVACDIPAASVWTELDRRTQVGELLASLNRTPGGRTGRAGRAIPHPWRIRTTKLP
ncbi:hypothetical protein AAC691_09905 [Nguyenibacter vanlangensis]|uniref:Uncharacterized protein n=1 Tax=Nguyenibacter vanlangensis TaxID=1216886 RepID=A0ABZ3DAH7_9PROT